MAYLEARLLEEAQRIADLEARLQQHSGNSSRLPSSDLPAAPPRPKHPPSGRQRGGQKGHPGHTRLQLADADLSAVMERRPVQCPSCSLPLSGDLPTEGETCANVDEIGWKQAGERRWLWVTVTALCTFFVVAKNLSAAVLLTLLGETFEGVVSSDRYKAYLSIPLERRQICWAHLKRNLIAFAERGGVIGDWGKEAVGIAEKVFAAWYRFKDGGGTRVQLQEEMASLRTQMQALWERGTTLPSWVVRGFCNDVGKLEPALWTFLTVEGVEPTNNAAERALRPAVLWRKGCFGADSTGGKEFVARILTVAATCRQQQRDLLTYLTDAVVAHRLGHSVPLLVTAA